MIEGIACRAIVDLGQQNSKQGSLPKPWYWHAAASKAGAGLPSAADSAAAIRAMAGASSARARRIRFMAGQYVRAQTAGQAPMPKGTGIGSRGAAGDNRLKKRRA